MSRTEALDAFTGGGELGELMRAIDWTGHPLGPVGTWPQSLRSVLSVCLTSRQPMGILWGTSMSMFYNDAYVPILGEKHPRALGEPLQEVWPEAWPTLRPVLESVREAGQAAYNDEQPLTLFRRGFHEETYFTFSFSPLWDETGAVGGIVFILTETTQRVLGERRLRFLTQLGSRTSSARSKEEALAATKATLEEGTADIPFAALYLCNWAERTAQRVLLAGTHPTGRSSPGTVELDGPEDPAAWPIAQVLRAGAPVVADGLSIRTRLPGPQPADHKSVALIVPIRTHGSEQPTAVLVVGVSPHVELDAAVRDFVGLVAAQISSTLVNATAYEEERKRAEALTELDRAKTAFFSNISHEFRTPLTLLLGPVEDGLADLQHPLPPVHRARQELVRRNALRLFKLVNMLLDFSRVEAGRAKVRYVPTDLAASTTELGSLFESAAKRAGLTLGIHCPALPEPVWVDPEAWENIVLNLLSNALKYTFSGGISLSLEAEGGAVRLTVRDTGTGIPASDLPHLFERFHRVEGARARSHEGSGIGLALVHELVKLHGGRVEVTSTLGEGSTFGVILPLGNAHLPTDKLADAPCPAPATTAAPLFLEEMQGWVSTPSGSPVVSAQAPAQDAVLPRGEQPTFVASTVTPPGRILLVDDNADLRSYIAGLLAPHYEVETATDGAEALDAIRRRVPDLVLSDVMMPRLSGFGLLRALRGDTRLRAIPFVLLSARAGEEAAVDGLDAGADDYLVKPFSARELQARVRTQLEMARVRREVARHEVMEASLRRELVARDDFLCIASHELKTPLTALQLALAGMQRLARKDTGNGDSTWIIERLDKAVLNAERLGYLVDQLLDISRVTTGELRLELADIDLAVAASEVAARFEETARQVGSEIRLQLEPATGRWDPIRVEQVAANLLSNALKYGRGKPIVVSVAPEGDDVILRVRDHGIGIAPEHQLRIFERFERAVGMRHYGGFGLGLWIAREVIEAHGGRISVESTPGEGATFTVRLPREPR